MCACKHCVCYGLQREGRIKFVGCCRRRAVLAFAGVLLLALLLGAAFWAVRAARRRGEAGAGAGGVGRAAGGSGGGGRGLGLGSGGQRFRAFEDKQEQELMPRAGGGVYPGSNPTSITILPLPGSPPPGTPAARVADPGDLPISR